MKLALVGAANSPHVIKWANALSAKDYDITLYSMADEKDEYAELSESVSVNYLPFAQTQKGFKKNVAPLKAALLQSSYDAIIAFDMATYGFTVAKTKASPVLMVSTGLDLLAKKSVLVKSIRCANAVCATAANIISELKTICKDEKKYFVTPFGVDVELFKNTAQEKGEHPCFGSVKFLEPINRVDAVIDAFAVFLKNHDDKATLKIVGNGSLEQELKNKVQTLGIGNNVEFLGYVKNSDLPAVISTFDVVVQLTSTERLGISGIEAMACEVPLVAGDTYGASEYILNSVTGYLVRAENINSACAQMAELVSNKAALAKMGVSCREDITEKYNLSDCTEKFIKAIQSVR